MNAHIITLFHCSRLLSPTAITKFKGNPSVEVSNTWERENFAINALYFGNIEIGQKLIQNTNSKS